MTSYFDQSLGSDPARTLPADFDAETRRIDELIALATAQDLDSAPRELADRVFDASVAMLPQPGAIPMRRHAETSRPGSRHVFSIHMHFGRFALAAMVFLAFGIGALMMHSAAVKSRGTGSLAD